MNKAFFFDIDGTLCHGSDDGIVIPNSAKESIIKLRDKGYKVFVATGRPEMFIPEIVYDIEFDGVICANGSVIKISNEMVYEKRFSNDFIGRLFDFCDEHGYSYMLEGDKAYVKDKEDVLILDLFDKLHLDRCHLCDEYDMNNSVTYNISIMGDVDEELVYNFFGDEYLFAKQDFAKFIDIYHKDSTKADGIRRILEHLKLDEFKSYAFGDGGNDLQMIKYADFGVAMGNARDELKEVADYVTTDVDKDGIENALKHLKILDQ